MVQSLYLSLEVQHLARYRLWQDRHSVLQSMSCQNQHIEHMWPEIHQRINYPVQTILVVMESGDGINMTNDTVKFVYHGQSSMSLRMQCITLFSLECPLNFWSKRRSTQHIGK